MYPIVQRLAVSPPSCGSHTSPTSPTMRPSACRITWNGTLLSGDPARSAASSSAGVARRLNQNSASLRTYGYGRWSEYAATFGSLEMSTWGKGEMQAYTGGNVVLVAGAVGRDSVPVRQGEVWLVAGPLGWGFCHGGLRLVR